ncbi:MAG: hypothetical protein PVG27_02210 [Chloroflexota bacterium]
MALRVVADLPIRGGQSEAWSETTVVDRAEPALPILDDLLEQSTRSFWRIVATRAREGIPSEEGLLRIRAVELDRFHDEWLEKGAGLRHLTLVEEIGCLLHALAVSALAAWVKEPHDSIDQSHRWTSVA